MLEFIDTHLHLNAPEYRDDLSTVIERARAAGVKHLITIGSGYGAENLESTISLSKTYDLLFALGIHPHDANLNLVDDERYDEKIERIIAKIRNEIHNKRLVAIGEIGLDFYYNHSPQDIQKETFARLLSFASEVRLPVIIHSRNSFDTTIDIIKAIKPNTKGVFHCFSGDTKQAKVVLDMGYYISIPGIVTFNKAREMQEVAKYIPIENLLIETDAPFLAPVPYRGKRNEPLFVIETYKFVAGLRNIPVDNLASSVIKNSFSCFNIRKDDKGDSAQG